MRTKKLLLLAAVLLSGVCATFAQNENEHPLDFILGIFDAQGEDCYRNWAVENWTATIKKDVSDPSKVWIYSFTPANFTNGIYGIVNEEKTKIHIPVNQPIGSNTKYDVFLENTYANTTGFIVGTISADGTITIEPSTWIRTATYYSGTQNFAGYYTSHRAVVFKKLDSTGSGIFLNADNFPDANFRAALAEKLYINEGDELAMGHLQTKKIVVSGKSITDLTGIEHFTALTELRCNNNQLTSLNVSKNTALTSLHCYENQLSSLDVSKNTALETLQCDNNKLTSLDVSKNTELKTLHCYNNQLTSLDLSKHTALKTLHCSNNQLTSLDVSNNAVLERLYCGGNQLATLDISKNIALKLLLCAGNKLTSLDFSQNKSLDFVHCHDNQLKGKAMDNLIESLPTMENGYIMVVDIFNANGANVCTKAQVAAAKEKGWTVTRQIEGCSGDYVDPYYGNEYEGSDPVEEDIDPVDEDDNIDFGSDMDENSDLGGNVIGDIFYNISDGNGEYNAEEGCIVLKKTTDDETVDGLSGKDIFGEDFKGQFTGILFKVPAGKGTVKVTAETTGNMLLKVKIGSGDPVEMELNGKLKVTFPYNVSEPTYVYIYAGAANEAKGLGTTNATTDAALKIYGIEFIKDDPTGIGTSLNDNGEMTNDSYYSIDGVKLNGEPRKKGIYIRNGKKVVK